MSHITQCTQRSPGRLQAQLERESPSLDEQRPPVAGFSRAQSAFQADQRRRSVRYRCNGSVVQLLLLPRR